MAAVSPSTIVVRELVAAPAFATKATRIARALAATIIATSRPRFFVDRVATAPFEDLDIPMLLS